MKKPHLFYLIIFCLYFVFDLIVNILSFSFHFFKDWLESINLLLLFLFFIIVIVYTIVYQIYIKNNLLTKKSESIADKKDSEKYKTLLNESYSLMDELYRSLMNSSAIDKNEITGNNIVSVTLNQHEFDYYNKKLNELKDFFHSIDLSKLLRYVSDDSQIFSCLIIRNQIPSLIHLIKSVINETETSTFNIIDKFEKVTQENTRAQLDADRNLEKIKSEIDGRNFESIIEEAGHAVGKYEDQIKTMLDLVHLLLNSQKDDEKKLIKIGKWIDQITDMLNNITEISERNRIIAINTSIEAARLGEQGKGFQILAYEIQKLNESTNTFIKDITQIINAFMQYNQEFMNDWTRRTKIINDKIQSTENLSEKIITKLINSYLLSTHSFVDLSASTKVVDKNLTQLLESLQFQDIIKQQLEKVTFFLKELYDKLSDQIKSSGISFTDFHANDLEAELIEEEQLAEVSRITIF